MLRLHTADHPTALFGLQCVIMELAYHTHLCILPLNRKFCLFVWFDSLRLINNLSVIKDGSS